jgi:hypothetical protein
LSVEDAKKSIEIALRHAQRFEELLGASNAVLFGATNPKTGEIRAATKILSKMKRRYFDSLWASS